MTSHPLLKGFSVDPVLASLPSAAKVYVVGGAVRDALLHRPSSDKDWVVVGATVDQMVKAGFTPVGADFPVFLHPHTHEEYALARTERKTGRGYKGFTFHADPAVTLEEDLARRDFTINAMAMSAAGELIDLHGGVQDLADSVMRHVSPAFVEDPLRVLRLARFLARFTDFTVAEETRVLCNTLRGQGELCELVPERIFTELNRGMGESAPSRMLEFIGALNAWADLSGGNRVPFAHFNPSQFELLDSLPGAEDRWVYGLGLFLNAAEISALAKHWRLPRDLQDLATVASALRSLAQQRPPSLDQINQFFAQVDLYRKPARLARVNLLLARLFGDSALHSFVQVAVGQIEQGIYKSFVGAKIQSVSGEMPVAEVAALARRQWLENLYSGQFSI